MEKLHPFFAQLGFELVYIYKYSYKSSTELIITHTLTYTRMKLHALLSSAVKDDPQCLKQQAGLG